MVEFSACDNKITSDEEFLLVKTFDRFNIPPEIIDKAKKRNKHINWDPFMSKTNKDQYQRNCNFDNDILGEASIDNLDKFYAQVLDLRGKLFKSDIKNKYIEKMNQYHPDKVAHLGPKLRLVAEEEAKLINEAYEYFKNKYNLK